MVVRYYTDEITEQDLATSYIVDENGNSILQTRTDGSPVRCQTDYNINIWKTPAPSENEIKEIITQSAPYDWFKLKIAIKNPDIDTSLSNVFPLLDREFVAIAPQPVSLEIVDKQAGTGVDLTEEEIEKLILQLTQSSSNSQNTLANTG
jgi:hypothetical protein